MFLFILLLLFFKSAWMGRMLYPIRYQDEITAAADQNNVDPLLIAAIIRVESNYRHDVVSHKGAYGIMQVMPDTAQWIFEMEGFHQYKLSDLENPGINILVGSKYLNFLNKQLGNNPYAVMAAYNAGQGKVAKWREEKIWDGSYATVDRIPFMETRKYVRSVTYYYDKYVKLYSGDFENIRKEAPGRS
ncbi:lytic transglycosylase domain-containing protein [Paenibacillus aurantius]|uniref:lytic transglycosylase domain-containing protein n=1 Tax=Paenibacillus aurantius TaxID=2918900 RepID=UPI0028E7B83D|nr:lytic transglycosylase domain-containing protein [Paenibacillus aurantius]WJH34667.1 lytic transglycosylase domain-containing protein [Paenibacillus sp. CC-CFT747]